MLRRESIEICFGTSLDQSTCMASSHDVGSSPYESSLELTASEAPETSKPEYVEPAPDVTAIYGLINIARELASKAKSLGDKNGYIGKIHAGLRGIVEYEADYIGQYKRGAEDIYVTDDVKAKLLKNISTEEEAAEVLRVGLWGVKALIIDKKLQYAFGTDWALNRTWMNDLNATISRKDREHYADMTKGKVYRLQQRKKEV